MTRVSGNAAACRPLLSVRLTPRSAGADCEVVQRRAYAYDLRHGLGTVAVGTAARPGGGARRDRGGAWVGVLRFGVGAAGGGHGGDWQDESADARVRAGRPGRNDGAGSPGRRGCGGVRVGGGAGAV